MKEEMSPAGETQRAGENEIAIASEQLAGWCFRLIRKQMREFRITSQ